MKKPPRSFAFKSKIELTIIIAVTPSTTSFFCRKKDRKKERKTKTETERDIERVREKEKERNW